MFTAFILKLTGLCNLNCSYCYMFNGLDRSFERKPSMMPAEIAVATLRAIAAYAGERGQPGISIVLHGGEPTLWPIASFQEFFDEVGRLRAAGLQVTIGMQTNMLRRLDPVLAQLLLAHDVSLGVSLDGPREANDAARVDFAGRGSYERILRNVRRLFEDGHGACFGGFLCVMRPDIDPQGFVRWVAELPVTRVDLIWPILHTQANPPWSAGEAAAYARQPEYGSWLEAVFDAWWRLDRPDIDIRLFRDAVQAAAGLRSALTDEMGAWSLNALVVDTDGEIELPDYFRAAADGAASTGHSVLQHGFAALENDPVIAGHRRAAEALPDACRRCRHRDVCRGGTLTGRLDGGGQVTAAASVLCPDHMRFFDAVAQRVEPALAAA